jgi:hypothetical protein
MLLVEARGKPVPSSLLCFLSPNAPRHRHIAKREVNKLLIARDLRPELIAPCELGDFEQLSQEQREKY